MMKSFNISEVSYSKIISNVSNSSGESYSNHEHAHANSLLDGFFMFIAIISIICNTFVVILFANNKKWLEKAYGRLVLSLATVDLLGAIFLFATPLAVHHQFRMLQPRNSIKRILYCNLLWSHYILFSFGITSVYTCLVLTVERWIAVSKPLYARKYKSTRWHKIMWLALPWIVGFLLEANVVNEIQIKHYDDGHFSCQWRARKVEAISVGLATISFVGGMIAPFFIISVMYVHILVTLRRKNSINRQGPILCENSQRPLNPAFYKIALNRTIRMAACATFAVLICWLPCQIYSLMAQIGYARPETTLHQLLNLLAFFNSCLNPALYAFTNRAFRKRFYHLFTKIHCQEDSSSENISL